MELKQTIQIMNKKTIIQVFGIILGWILMVATITSISVHAINNILIVIAQSF